MAHLVDTMMSVREIPWHGLGEVPDTYPKDWATARKLAGLDWEPIEDTVYAPVAMTGLTDDVFARVFGEAAPGSVPEVAPVEDYKLLRRSDTGLVLAVHRRSYETFPNGELGPLVEALLDEDDVLYETAGSLDEGRKVWVMLRLAEPFEIPGDPYGATLSYLSLWNSHDGTSALTASRNQTRIVCANTLGAADRESGKHGLRYSFRHTANMKDRIEDAKKAINGLREDRETYIEWAHELMGIELDERQQELWLAEFVPMPAVASDRVRNNVEKTRQQIRTILESPTCEAVSHTAYGLVQASVEWVQHVRPVKGANPGEQRLKRSLDPNPLAKQAEKFAREMANA
jgi:phage/plasmid-like protein (TIGR03299 family)